MKSPNEKISNKEKKSKKNKTALNTTSQKKAKKTKRVKNTKGTQNTKSAKSTKRTKINSNVENENNNETTQVTELIGNRVKKSDDIKLEQFLELNLRKRTFKNFVKPSLVSSYFGHINMKKVKKALKKRGRPKKNKFTNSKSSAKKPYSKVTNEDVKRVFETKLRKKRLILGLTQVQMADKVGMSVDFYRDIESGRNTGSIATMLNLCNALKIPPNQFFEDLLNDLKYQTRDYTIQQYFNRFSDKDKLALKRLIIYLDKYYSREE